MQLSAFFFLDSLSIDQTVFSDQGCNTFKSTMFSKTFIHVCTFNLFVSKQSKILIFTVLGSGDKTGNLKKKKERAHSGSKGSFTEVSSADACSQC